MSDAAGLYFFFIVMGIMGAFLALNEIAKRSFVADVRARWARQAWAGGRDPVGALYYGSQMKRSRTNYRGKFGALGITRGQLVCHQRNNTEVFIPLEDITWAGVHAIRIHQGKTSVYRDALIVHFVQHGHYDVVAWVTRDPLGIVAALETHIGKKARIAGKFREDRGPMQAVQVQQDIYGRWEEAFPLQGERDLYLAPDRLVIGNRAWILFSQLRQVDVYEKDNLLHQLNPFAKDLLRIEYDTSEGEHTVTGFLVRDADGWAEQIGQMTRVPVGIHTGRKKK